MKHPFAKSVLILSTALALLGCDDEVSTVTPATPSQEASVPSADSPIVSGTSAADMKVNQDCWIFNAGDKTYVITTNLSVYDGNGVKVGTYDPVGQTITSTAGTAIAAGVDFNELPLLQPAGTTTPVASSGSTAGTTPVTGISSAVVTPISSATVTPVATSSSSKGNQQATSSSSQKEQQATSSAAQQGTDGTCFDKANNKNVKPYDNLSGKNGESYAYKEDCTISCYYDPANNNCASVATSTGSNNNQQQTQQSSSSQAKSSSSVAKSSSSQAKSSSSQQTQQGTTGTGSFAGAKVISSSYTVKATGGKSGSGWATRYWDCCKPHCAWPGKGGKQATACDASGNKISDDGAKSMCDGGNSGTCKGQIPMIVNEKLAFAFAAVPGSAGGECGKCFALEFTGTGKYETKANHKAMAGKTLVVIASNIGYDVAEGQFDIMIPGGGYGIFNGCANKMGWGDQGAQYGGLLSQCEDEVGYNGDLLTKRKECLANKCEKSFSGDPVAKQGCMFLATWYEAAGNPNHNFKEVECPQELLSIF